MTDKLHLDDLQKAVNDATDAYNKGYGSLKQVQQAQLDAKMGVKDFAVNMAKDMAALGTSVKSIASSTMDGKEGASVYNSTITAAADVVDTVASAFGPLGKLIGTLITAGAKYVVAVNEQADKLFDTYRDISKVGVTGASGMRGVFDNLQNFGLTIKELGQMGKLLKENSEALANFGGTAAQGAKQFSELSRDVRQSDIGMQLKQLGMSNETINDGLASYVKIGVENGSLQKKSQADLVQGAKDFLIEQDRLTKLTGLDSKSQQALTEQALRNERYRAATYEIEKKGDKESLDKIKSLDSIQKRLSVVAPKYREGMLAAAAGMLDDPEALKLKLAAPKAFEMLQKGTINETEFFKTIAEEMDRTVTQNTSLAKQGSFGKLFGSLEEAQRLRHINDKNALDKKEEAVADEQRVTDTATNSMVELTTSQRNATMEFDKLTNAGMALTNISKGLAKVNEGVAAAPGAVLGTPATGTNKAPGKGMTQEDLIKSGLKIKSGDVQGAGNTLNPAILELAKKVQGGVSNFKHFSGFNDKWHNENAGNSKHAKGLAMDFTLTAPPTKDEGQKIVNYLKSMGASLAIDEYNNPSSKATAGHIHAEVPQAAKGGILSGPTSGYRAMLHGTEAVVPMNNNKTITVKGSGGGATKQRVAMLNTQLSKIESMIVAVDEHNRIQNRILQMKS